MIRYIMKKIMPKILKVNELNKLEDLMYYNYKYLINTYGSPYSYNEVKKAVKIVNECIACTRFNTEVEL